jgi:ABC-type sugar transport system substrate-binding protein
VACLVVVVACGGTSTTGTGGGVAWGAPWKIQASWGTFTLSSKIVAKLQNRTPINFVEEGQAAGIPVLSQLFETGYKSAVPDASKIYPLHDSYYAPPGNQYDQGEQISQVQAQLNAGQIDCLAVVPVNSNGLNTLIAQMADQGIPVFIQGVPNQGHELGYYGQVPNKEGVQAANTLLQWMKDNNKSFKTFAVTSGVPSADWAQGRMTSFITTLKASIPDATFINDQTSALDTSLDPAATYDKARAFLQGHTNVDLVMNTDIGAEFIDKAIVDLKMSGKVYTLGWNVSKSNLTYIDQGVQVATMDQNVTGQGQYGPKACANLMQSGKVIANDLTLAPILKADVSKVRAAYGF